MDTPKGAKQFREPLMQALGDLSGMKANVAVDHRSAYEVICKRMGITLDQFGCQGGTGAPWVERWTQWAFKNLTDMVPPLTVAMGKGKWALTPHGIAKVLALSSGVDMNIPIPETVNVDVSPYLRDPYIRSLAIPETKCYDNFSDQSPICEDCPLQSGCQNAQLAAFSDLARSLIIEDEKSAKALKDEMEKKATGAAALKATANRPPDPVKPTVPAPTPAKTPGVLSAPQRVLCAQSALCSECNQEITQGADCIWVRGVKGGAGLYHVSCYDSKVSK